MKYVLFLMLSLITVVLFGQLGEKTAVFKTTKYESEYQSYSVEIDTISWSSKLDLDFYGKHFAILYFTCPEVLVNPAYKNEKIEVCALP